MGKSLRQRLLWGLVLLVSLAGLGLGAGLLYADRLLDGVVRPRLERLAAERLQAQVRAGRLVWEDGGLTLSELSVERRDRYRLTLVRARVLFSWRDLLRRRLSVVHLTAPRLEIFPSPEPSAPSPLVLPDAPPLTVGCLTIEAGAISSADPGRPWEVRDIAFSLRGDAAFAFDVCGRLAARTPIPFVLSGRGEWQGGLRLQVNALNWQGRSLLREPVTLALPAGTDASRLQLSLSLGRVRDGDLRQWLAAFSLAVPLPPDWDFVINDVRLAADWQGGVLQTRLSLTDGRLRVPGATLPLVSLELSAVSRQRDWQGEGRFALVEGTAGTLRFQAGATPPQGSLTLVVEDPGQLQQQVLGKVPLPMAGTAQVSAEGQWRDGRLGVSFALQGRPGAAAPADARLDITALTLDGTLEQRRDAWHAAADLQLAGRPLATVNGGSRRVEIVLQATPWSRLRNLLPAAVRPAWLKDALGLSGRAVLNRNRQDWQADGTLRAARISLHQGQIRNLRFRGRIVPRDQGLALTGGRLSGRLVDERLGEGDLQARFAARLWQESWQLDLAGLDLGPLELMSSDGLAGLAGGRLQLRGRVSRSGAAAPLDFNLTGRGSAKEALWGAWYGELAALPADLALRGRWQPAAARLALQDAVLDVDGLARLRLAGEHRPEGLALQGTLQVSDLAAAWGGHGRALLRELRPELADLQLAGALEADLDLAGGAGRWRLRGEARLRDLAADWPRLALTARGGRGTLPLALTWPAHRGKEEPPRQGRLSFAALRCGPVRLAEPTLQLAVGDNRLAIEQTLRLAVAGGKVAIDRLQAGYDPGGPRFEASIRMGGIDLERLTSELGMVPMAGTIDADLGHIRYVGGRLQSDGEVRVAAFGGGLLLRNLQLDPFSLEQPQFRADIDFTGIDLYRLTQTFSFGAIHGVVDGRVRGLRLYGTTPSHFVAHMETRLEGKRDISVKALNNLSILSQGGLSAALSRGIYQFIDYYRYRRIGIACELEEDVFTLRGTARAGSDRYLVDGGLLPPKINIIAPSRQISFREMLRRLQRIDRTARRAD